MALPADKEGFLIADKKFPIDLASFKRGLDLLMEIRKDTHAMRQSMDSTKAAVAKQTKMQSQSIAVSKSQTKQLTKALEKNVRATVAKRTDSSAIRDSKARISPKQAQVKVVTAARTSDVAPVIAAAAETVKEVVTAGTRDARGRFVKRDNEGNPIVNESAATPVPAIEKAQVTAVDKKQKWSFMKWIEKFRKESKPKKNDEDSISSGKNKYGDLKDAGKEVAVETADTAAQIDATAAATKEVASIASPFLKVFKGVGGLFGFGKDKEEKTQEKVAKKVHVPWYKKILKALGAANNSSLTDIFSGLGTGLKAMLSGAAGLVGGLLAKSVGFVSSIVKYAPFLAKLATPVAMLFSAVKSFRTSTEEYAKKFGVEGGTFWSDLGIRIAGVFTDLGNILTLGLAGWVGEKLSPSIGDGIDYIKKKFGDAADAVINFFGAIKEKVEAVKNYGQEKLNSAKEFVADAKDSTKQYWGDKFNSAKNFAAGGFDMAKSAIGMDGNSAAMSDNQVQLTKTVNLNDSVVKLSDSITNLTGIISPTSVTAFPSVGKMGAVSASAAPSVNAANIPNQVPVDRKMAGLSNKESQSISVTMPQQINQNVADRSLAHIATGGMAAYSTGNR